MTGDKCPKCGHDQLDPVGRWVDNVICRKCGSSVSGLELAVQRSKRAQEKGQLSPALSLQPKRR